MKRSRLPLLGLFFLTACSSATIEGVKTYTYASGVHQEGLITYRETPAVGGPHNQSWQDCGVYTAPLYPMYTVHSLEHGAVSITYQPGLSADQVKALTDLTRARRYTLLSPLEQASPIMLSAWGVQLSVDTVSDARVAAFLRKYEQASTAPEPGAPCTGGVTTTT